jgi:hypothetical protein
MSDHAFAIACEVARHGGSAPRRRPRSGDAHGRMHMQRSRTVYVGDLHRTHCMQLQCYTPTPSRCFGCSRLQSARASDAHVNRIGGRKALIDLLLSAVSCAIQKRNGVIIHTALQKILAALSRPQGPIGIP